MLIHLMLLLKVTMIDSDQKSNIFFIVLFFLFVYAVIGLYYKYIFSEDVFYFLNENDVPEQFDLANYPD